MLSRRLIVVLFTIRTLALLHVIVVELAGLPVGLMYLFAFIVLYNLALFFVWRKRNSTFQPNLAFLLTDVFVSIGAVWLSGATWNSPYFPYAFTSLMLTGSFVTLRLGLAVTALFTALYTGGLLLLTESTSSLIATNMDTLFGNYTAFFLVLFFFGYPTSIFREAEAAQQAAALARSSAEDMRSLSDGLQAYMALTPRQQQIAVLLCEGAATKDIAERLFISEHTAKNHSRNIYKKLGINDRISLMLLFHCTNQPDTAPRQTAAKPPVPLP